MLAGNKLRASIDTRTFMASNPRQGPAKRPAAPPPAEDSMPWTLIILTTSCWPVPQPALWPAAGYAATSTSAARAIRPAAPSRAPAESSALVALATRRPVSPPPPRSETEAFSSDPAVARASS